MHLSFAILQSISLMQKCPFEHVKKCSNKKQSICTPTAHPGSPSKTDRQDKLSSLYITWRDFIKNYNEKKIFYSYVKLFVVLFICVLNDSEPNVHPTNVNFPLAFSKGKHTLQFKQLIQFFLQSIFA